MESGTLDINEIFKTNYDDIFASKFDGLKFSFESNFPRTDLEIPEADFFITYTEADDEILEYSRTHDCSVIALGFKPTEALHELRISSETLISGLTTTINLLSNGIKKSIKSISKAPKSTRQFASNLRFDVIGVQHASFRVLLKANDQVDLFKISEFPNGMKLIDALFDAKSNPAEFSEILKNNPGHLIGSMKSFADFIVSHDCPFYYSWISPTMDEPLRHEITINDAKAIIRLYDDISELDGEDIALYGEAIKADKKRGLWSIYNTTESKEYSGRLKGEEGGADLSGIVIGDYYQFNCREFFEIDPIKGSKKVKYELVSFSPFERPAQII